ncbi:uncharacterized protein AC631_01347 [Debaryomyces fabryi]|uniref:Uncharacterized protein n=1 Tax=Debaryomyces fabryi TaxID=58627 RepID=A0A0V1Q323_9ASCO|nr:uncharacterized protein AC631_01347 [Debaryomyces fabryi]KSA02867.1 hypothetical protein AC631_01347 [Debaryomyces fabryi]CUM45059.1 unnamed protein product [Debaryomyces fabryi]
MGKFDDEMWDLNPNSIGLPSLHRPRSSKNNTMNGLMMNLFNAESTGVKKRPKTIHVYGMDNKKVENDFLDLLSRSKADSKPARGPLQEKDLNTSRPESAKTIDLLDMGVLLSSRSQKTVPIEDGINLLQSDHNYPNEMAGLVPHTSNGYEMEELQSQISTVTLENEDLFTKRSVTLPHMRSVSDKGCTRLTKSAGTDEIDDESVADSEDEPELLSTSLSSQSRKGSRSSTVNIFEQNRTFDTSVLADQEKIVYDDTLIEENNLDSQLTNVNIQAEDFVKDDSEVFSVEHESIEQPDDCDMEYSEESTRDIQPQLIFQISTSSYQDLHNSNNISSHHSQQNKGSDKIIGNVPHDISTNVNPGGVDESTSAKAKHTPEMADATPNSSGPVLPPPYPSSRERKRKNSLADICSKTNRARLPPRVGLSKKMKVDSLHDYLKK